MSDIPNRQAYGTYAVTYDPGYKNKPWVVKGPPVCAGEDRIRLGYETQKEAAKAASEFTKLRTKNKEATKGNRATYSPAEIREMQACFSLYKAAGLPREMMYYLMLGIHYASKADGDIGKQVDTYVADLKENGRSEDYTRGVKRRLQRFSYAFSGTPVDQIDVDAVNQYLKSLKDQKGNNASIAEKGHVREALSAFFSSLVLADKLGRNPVKGTLKFTVKQEPADEEFKIIRLKTVKELFEFLETYTGIKGDQKPGFLVPYFVFCLLLAVRCWAHGNELATLSKNTTEAFKWPGKIKVYTKDSRTDSRKMQIRFITIFAHVAAWFYKYPLSEYPIFFVGFKKEVEFVKAKFGITENAMRHTGLSGLAGLSKVMKWVAHEGGTSVEMLDERYLHVAFADGLVGLFEIFPSGVDVNQFREEYRNLKPWSKFV